MKKVLVIRCGALGDLVYATSVIDALLLEYGSNTIIDFVCTPSSGTLFKKDPRVHQVFPLKHKKIPIVFSKEKKAIIQISKKEPYDILINFEHGKQFLPLLKAIEAKQKVGPQLSTVQTSKETIHMVEIIKESYKEIISVNNLQKSFPRLIATPIEEVRKKYSLPDKFIIISPSNSHQKKNKLNYRAWPDSYWIKLIKELANKTNIIIIGAKHEDNFFNKIRPFPKTVIDLVGKTDLCDLVGIIEAGNALIATDTGTAHIASAVNTEVFALIGPTPANVTGPYQTPLNKVHIISAHLPCSPCYKTDIMKNCKDNICMKEINVTMVLNSVKHHLHL